MASVGLGNTQITTLTTAVGIGSIPPGTTFALIQCEAQPVRFLDTGVVPTATVGTILNVGDILKYDGLFAKLLFIESSVGAKLNILFYTDAL